MNTPDFSGIDPLRVPEARRRVAALNEYLTALIRDDVVLGEDQSLAAAGV